MENQGILTNRPFTRLARNAVSFALDKVSNNLENKFLNLNSSKASGTSLEAKREANRELASVLSRAASATQAKKVSERSDEEIEKQIGGLIRRIAGQNFGKWLQQVKKINDKRPETMKRARNKLADLSFRMAESVRRTFDFPSLADDQKARLYGIYFRVYSNEILNWVEGPEELKAIHDKIGSFANKVKDDKYLDAIPKNIRENTVSELNKLVDGHKTRLAEFADSELREIVNANVDSYVKLLLDLDALVAKLQDAKGKEKLSKSATKARNAMHTYICDKAAAISNQIIGPAMDDYIEDINAAIKKAGNDPEELQRLMNEAQEKGRRSNKADAPDQAKPKAKAEKKQEPVAAGA